MPYVQITIASGRSHEVKRSAMASVALALHEATGAPLETIHVWITEVDPSELSIAGVPLDELRARREAEAGGPR